MFIVCFKAECSALTYTKAECPALVYVSYSFWILSVNTFVKDKTIIFIQLNHIFIFSPFVGFMASQKVSICFVRFLWFYDSLVLPTHIHIHIHRHIHILIHIHVHIHIHTHTPPKWQRLPVLSFTSVAAIRSDSCTLLVPSLTFPHQRHSVWGISEWTFHSTAPLSPKHSPLRNTGKGSWELRQQILRGRAMPMGHPDGIGTTCTCVLGKENICPRVKLGYQL